MKSEKQQTCYIIIKELQLKNLALEYKLTIKVPEIIWSPKIFFKDKNCVKFQKNDKKLPNQ